MVENHSLPLLPCNPEAFGDPVDRHRLTPVAIKAFKAIAARWDLSLAESAALLGMSEADWLLHQAGLSTRPLSQDQMTRLSALLGLYKGLVETFSEDVAARWPRLKNAGPVFRDRTPIRGMIEDGTPTILDARHLIEAVSGGA